MDLENLCVFGGFFFYVKDNLFWIWKVIDFIDYKMLWLNCIKLSIGILFIKKMIIIFFFLFDFKS